MPTPARGSVEKCFRKIPAGEISKATAIWEGVLFRRPPPYVSQYHVGSLRILEFPLKLLFLLFDKCYENHI